MVEGINSLFGRSNAFRQGMLRACFKFLNQLIRVGFVEFKNKLVLVAHEPKLTKVHSWVNTATSLQFLDRQHSVVLPTPAFFRRERGFSGLFSRQLHAFLQHLNRDIRLLFGGDQRGGDADGAGAAA
jgi:hypothetical protein